MCQSTNNIPDVCLFLRRCGHHPFKFLEKRKHTVEKISLQKPQSHDITEVFPEATLDITQVALHVWGNVRINDCAGGREKEEPFLLDVTTAAGYPITAQFFRKVRQSGKY